MKIITESWEDLDRTPTEALYLDKDGQYTISEFIELLEAAKQKWGDKEIQFHNMNLGCIGGFSRLYLHHGFDDREKYGEDYYMDDTVCIYG